MYIFESVLRIKINQVSRNQSVRGATPRATHYNITMGNDIARYAHCYITMGNGVVKCTYHGITIHNDIDIGMKHSYYVHLYYPHINLEHHCNYKTIIMQ